MFKNPVCCRISAINLPWEKPGQPFDHLTSSPSRLCGKSVVPPNSRPWAEKDRDTPWGVCFLILQYMWYNVIMCSYYTYIYIYTMSIWSIDGTPCWVSILSCSNRCQKWPRDGLSALIPSCSCNGSFLLKSEVRVVRISNEELDVMPFCISEMPQGKHRMSKI